MENSEKEVDFWTYCSKCKHERLDMCPDCYEQFIINIGAINRKKEREAEKQNAQT